MELVVSVYYRWMLQDCLLLQVARRGTRSLRLGAIPGEVLPMVVVSLGAEEATTPLPLLMVRLVVCECSLLSCASPHSISLTRTRCSQPGHFARDCPEKPAGGGLTGECYNCGEVGHNKADCTNPRVERAFTGTCNSCGVDGHAARDCPTMKCKLCDQPGHRALNCNQRRMVNWDGVPELTAEEAWKGLIDASHAKDLDAFRLCLRAYACAVTTEFNLPAIEQALREDNSPVYLVAKQQPIASNMTIVDPIGNPEREWVLTFQYSAKPRRPRLAEGWPESPEKNLERLASAGFVEDRGVPLCGNCGDLGHIRKVSLFHFYSDGPC
jgi:hypothetical protein